MNLGTPELLILLAVVVLVFGAGWLPKAARNLGRAKVELDKTRSELEKSKADFIETAGLDKAEQSLRKANKALNQSPKSLIAGAVTSSRTPAPDAEPVTPDTGAPPGGDDDAEAAPETVNVDFSDDDT